MSKVKEIFSSSEKMKEEYCATVVQIGELTPIEGSDFLAQTIVDGFSIVVRKDEFSTGDVAIYAKNETELNHDFLSSNNLFELSERELNKNYEEVQRLIDEGKTDDARKLVGFFNKRGRVKMIRLRGCPSMGVLFKMDAISKWIKSTEDVNLENYIGFNFDTICGKEFIKAYVPFMPSQSKGGKRNKRDEKLNQFDRLIPGEFAFHYDTLQLNSNIQRIKPTDSVTISIKMHGTSAIFANVLIKKPLVFSAGRKLIADYQSHKVQKIRKRLSAVPHIRERQKKEIREILGKKPKNYTVGFGNVYSSRTVVKNQYINKNVGSGYYSVDVWSMANSVISPYIPNGMTVYAEICGYEDKSDKFIQKNYDYGCEKGKWFIMPYRITTAVEGTTKKKEWSVLEVEKWTKELLKSNKELKEFIRVIPVVYHGTLASLYPDVSLEQHWQENILAKMKEDKEHFGMEENEPFCKNKVPREGICIRVDDDPINECFKLKCAKFLLKEGELMTAIAEGKEKISEEMAEAYA